MQDVELSVLYVEDDVDMREAVAQRLSGRFKDIYMCSSAEEALIIFENQHVDLILTDYFLPETNGIDMIAKIRQKNWDIPIILITGHVDTQLLIETINLGVTQFVPKPVNPKVLSNAVDLSIQRVAMENLKRKNQQQELELLKYREKYHSSQQEAAFHKELYVLKNDCFERIIDVKGERWMVDINYNGLDIISGDSYSVRHISESKVLCFVLDAMGKGVSASVTSVAATSYINHLIDMSSAIDLKEIVGSFLDFITGILFYEEILCASFLLFDFETLTLNYACFSMPKLWINYLDGTVASVCSNNMPIMKDSKSFSLDCLSIENLHKLMASSDGLTEAVKGDTVYEQFVCDDFKANALLSGFMKQLKERGFEVKDDITVFYLRRFTTNPKWEVSRTVDSNSEGLDELDKFFNESISILNMDARIATELYIAFTEAVSNAFEHGSLEIGSLEKHNALYLDSYEELIVAKTLMYAGKKIHCHIAYIDKDAPVIRIRVIDEGNGFKGENLNFGNNKLFSGRGLELIRRYTDKRYFTAKGNEIIMVKNLVSI
jgi:CheY-like chemotaxis protein/anti-sigma regulatory factor (Ser/Thr protein kinase)